MVTYASGSVRVPGLSGNDTDFVGMIKKLRDIESRQVNQLNRWKQDWKTRLNAFKELRGELMNLQSTLNTLNSLDKFLAKATVSSDDKKVTAVADADSVNSSYKLEVNQLASNATWTKALPLYDKKDVIAEETGYIEYSYKGKTRRVNVPKNTTVEGFIKLINNDSKNLGVRAQIIQGADGLTFQLRGMDTGKSNSLVIKETSNIKGLDVTLGDGNYSIDKNNVKFRDSFTSPNDIINDSGSSQTFVYTVDGAEKTITVQDGWTIQQLTDAINAQTPGVAHLDEQNGKYFFSLQNHDVKYAFEADPGDGSGKFDEVFGKDFSSYSDKVNPSGPPFELKFQVRTVGGGTAQHSVQVDENMTVQDLMDAIELQVGQPCKFSEKNGSTAGTFNLQVEVEPTEHRVTVESSTLDRLGYAKSDSPVWEESSSSDSGAVVSLRDGFASKDAVINNTGEAKTFVYTLNGTRRVVEVQDQWTIEDLQNAVNAQVPGLANLTQGSDGKYYFSLEKPNTKHYYREKEGDVSGKFDELMGKEWGGDSEKVLPSGGQPYDFQFQLESSEGGDPVVKTISIDEEMTLRDLVNAIQAQIGNKGKVTLRAGDVDPSKFKIEVKMEDTEHRLSVEDGTLDSMTYVPPSDPNWDVSQAQNAQVRINNYPSDKEKWLEVGSNTLKSGEVMPGITFYLHSTGDAEISVSTDTAKIKENIQTFVDAVNSFRTKLMELTEYDESKEVLDPEYAESQFEMQKGGVLQGNYGVQMVATRLKNAVAGNALGFSKRMLDTDGSVLSGDMFNTLSQIGITTNATRGEANYGLLEINFIAGKGGAKSLDQALADDPEAVAKLFGVTNVGESHSDHFHYDSHLSSITKPGSYDVSYQILPDGTIDETTAYINGQLASVNQETKTLTAIGDNNPAKGLVILVADSTPGLVVKDETVSIKSGKVQEVLSLLEGSEGILGTNGTLKNLERNYQGIIDGIDKKIKREDDRIKRWENTMVHKFARLEAVLANYSGLQKTLESQLEQLKSK